MGVTISFPPHPPTRSSTPPAPHWPPPGEAGLSMIGIDEINGVLAFEDGYTYEFKNRSKLSEALRLGLPIRAEIANRAPHNQDLAMGGDELIKFLGMIEHRRHRDPRKDFTSWHNGGIGNGGYQAWIADRVHLTQHLRWARVPGQRTPTRAFTEHEKSTALEALIYAVFEDSGDFITASTTRDVMERFALWWPPSSLQPRGSFEMIATWKGSPVS